MKQTSYTGITNLGKKIPYIGGLCKIWFIPVEEVGSISVIDPLSQLLTDEIELLEGVTGWRGPIPVPDASLGFTETYKPDGAGGYYEQKVSAISYGDNTTHRVNLDNMAYAKYLVVGKQRAGGMYLLFGSLDSPMDFDQQYNNGPGAGTSVSTKIAFSGESIHKALILPSFNGDTTEIPPSSGSNETEVIHFEFENTVDIYWTLTREMRFGSFPEVELYLLGDDSKYYKAAVQPYCDAPPPDFTKLTFEFPANETGFIVIK